MMTPRYRNALITGASSGIGRALAVVLARDGVEVVATARREAELLALKDEVAATGGRLSIEVMDVADGDRTVAQIRALDDRLAGLELIVANAGVGLGRGHPLSWEAAREATQINYAGALATLTAVLPRMIERGRGHLVGVCSLASFGALPGAAAYCAPKAGLSMFLDCLRLDLAESGVAVTTVNPGFIRTPMVAHAKHPMPQLMDAADAAELIWTRLRDRPARIDFPQPLAFIARIAGALPRPLHDLIVRLTANPAGQVRQLR